MIKLSLTRAIEVVAALLGVRASVALIGAPGMGKTRTSCNIARMVGALVPVNGGSESDWKQLFPYRKLDGSIELGTAMVAAGFELRDGQPVCTREEGGTIVLDEFNRVPAHAASPFQLLASEKAVAWPGTAVTHPLNLAFIGTANDDDLGVEESPRAMLDRFDIFLSLVPTEDEVAAIAVDSFPPPDEARVRAIYARANRAPKLTDEASRLVVRYVEELSRRFVGRPFFRPEGIRMVRSVSRLLPAQILTPAEVFRGCAERCWPLGRKTVAKLRPEFDSIVADVSSRFATAIASLRSFCTTVAPVPAPAAAPSRPADPRSLAELLKLAQGSASPKISCPPLPLPRPITSLMTQLIGAFGMGVAKHLVLRRQSGAKEAERAGVRVCFGSPDTVQFKDADRKEVVEFCRALGL